MCGENLVRESRRELAAEAFQSGVGDLKAISNELAVTQLSVALCCVVLRVVRRAGVKATPPQ